MINQEIVEKFNIPGKLEKIEQITTGNIHKTYVAIYSEKGEKSKYLIQQINNYVFKNPYDMFFNTGINIYVIWKI